MKHCFYSVNYLNCNCIPLHMWTGVGLDLDLIWMDMVGLWILRYVSMNQDSWMGGMDGTESDRLDLIESDRVLSPGEIWQTRQD
jgi:hypothetical protein